MAKQEKENIIVVQEVINFDKAIKLYKDENEIAKTTMADKEAVLHFVKKFIPSLIETKEEFYKILKKY